MCLYGEGVGCKAVVGHGSGGRPRHGLHVKSTLESDENFKQNLLESSEVPGGSKNELKTYSITHNPTRPAWAIGISTIAATSHNHDIKICNLLQHHLFNWSGPPCTNRYPITLLPPCRQLFLGVPS
jgi:hypothetical protein